MKRPVPKNAIHKLWAWISLCINILVSSIMYSLFTSAISMLIVGISFVVVFLMFGLNKVNRDVAVNDLSISSVFVSYIGALILSVILVYVTCLHTSFLSLVCLLPILLFECIIAIIISRSNYLW